LQAEKKVKHAKAEEKRNSLKQVKLAALEEKKLVTAAKSKKWAEQQLEAVHEAERLSIEQEQQRMAEADTMAAFKLRGLRQGMDRGKHDVREAKSKSRRAGRKGRSGTPSSRGGQRSEADELELLSAGAGAGDDEVLALTVVDDDGDGAGPRRPRRRTSVIEANFVPIFRQKSTYGQQQGPAQPGPAQPPPPPPLKSMSTLPKSFGADGDGPNRLTMMPKVHRYEEAFQALTRKQKIKKASQRASPPVRSSPPVARLLWRSFSRFEAALV
jgi:hypothetical protein